MGVLDRYSALIFPIKEAPRRSTLGSEELEKLVPVVLEDNKKDITLAEAEVASKGFIKVHRIKDYRRKDSSILLIPNVKTRLDFLINKGGEQCLPTL